MEKKFRFQRKFRIWVFSAGIWKKLLSFSKSVLPNFLICEFSCKNTKYLHLGQKLFIRVLFDWNSKKSLSFLKSTPWISVSAKFGAKQKCLNLGSKIPDLGIFWLEVENNIAIIEISSLIANYHKKQKCLNVGPKIIFG